MPSMQETIERLVSVVTELNRRRGIADFPRTREPATNDTLKLMQDTIVARLPVSLRQFLLVTNGLSDAGPGLSLYGSSDVVGPDYKDRVLGLKRNSRSWNAPILETGVLIGGSNEQSLEGYQLFMDMKTWKARRRECDLVLWNRAGGEIHRAPGMDRFLQNYIELCGTQISIADR